MLVDINRQPDRAYPSNTPITAFQVISIILGR
jgi:hypothetical protein